MIEYHFKVTVKPACGGEIIIPNVIVRRSKDDHLSDIDRYLVDLYETHKQYEVDVELITCFDVIGE